jgi:5-methyltetrahydrofolate--homocysteine methyltransferase
MEPILQNIYQGIVDGKHRDVEAEVQAALQAGIAPKRILDTGMIAAMAEVGRLFELGEYYLPEMLVSARAMQAGLAVLRPQLKEAHIQYSGRIAIGTVKGDLHDIGKNLVLMMLEGAGFEVLDLGTDVEPERFVAAVKTGEVQILALSALLSTTMPSMKATIEALKEAGLRDHIKVMVGGAPITETFANLIGADGFAPDASRAVTLAKSLMES